MSRLNCPKPDKFVFRWKPAPKFLTLDNLNKPQPNYSRTALKKSPRLCTKTFSANLTTSTVLLAQSCDCSYYVIRPVLAPPSFWLQQHTDLRAHNLAHSLWLDNITCTWSWRLCGITPALYGTAVAQWLSCCATNRKVDGSIPDGVIGIFHSHNPPDHTMTLGSTQPLTEMSTRRISWG